jgi:hypothetical protein
MGTLRQIRIREKVLAGKLYQFRLVGDRYAAITVTKVEPRKGVKSEQTQTCRKQGVQAERYECEPEDRNTVQSTDNFCSYRTAVAQPVEPHIHRLAGRNPK